MIGKHHRATTDFVEPDLPITPMLDMSFQLMAFFIFTFRPMPTEGQIAMALPSEKGGADVAPSATDDKPVTFVVRVDATENGQIARMVLSEKDAAETRGVDLGADVKKYQAELKSRYESLKGKPGKLTLELANNLATEYWVQLTDIGIRAGFTDIAPVPAEKK